MENAIFLGLSVQAWYLIAVTIGMFYTLTRTHVPAEVAFLGVVTLYLAGGLVNVHDVVSGLGSEAVVVSGAFFIMQASLNLTGVSYWLSQHWLGSPKSYRQAIVKLMTPVALLSAMMGGENVVSMFTDTVKQWARKLGISHAKLLIPLSYAATFGGMCTLLGQSSNLVIAGLYAEQTGTSLNLLAPLVPGVVCTVVGMLMMLLQQRFLPEREAPELSFEDISDYTVELLVPTDNPAVMMKVADTGLKNVRGGSLIEIVRFDKEVISPVDDDEFIFGGDRLIYSGQINELLKLKQTHGLVAADHHIYSINEIDSNRKLRTAYVNFGSDLIGTSMSHNKFEKRNDMTLVAVARQGKRVDEQPREVKLEAGDTLLLECPQKADRDLQTTLKRTLTFFDSQYVPQLGPRTIWTSVVLVAIFVLSSFNVLPLLTVTMLAAGALIMMRCCRMDSITKYIDWNYLLLLGSLVVFSIAITKTGIMTPVADWVLRVCKENPYIIIIVMSIMASLVSEVFSNIAAGAVFFPLVYQQAMILGCNPLPFVIALMTSVTISYCTPIGSTTIMQIYGPGGFKFTDFWRIGIWMHLALLLVNLITIFIVFPMY